MALLAAEIENSPPTQYKVIIVDDLTTMASYSVEMVIMRFFTTCRRLSDNGRTKFLVARSYAFDEKMFNRVKVVADAHLSLRAEKMGGKTVKTMEVRKINNVELRSGNEVSFEVAQGAGMRVIPGGKIKV